jgi:hypothetical protein
MADTPTDLRFRMLETVREFSTAEREAAGETARAVGGFLAWARDFGVAHNDAPFGPDPYPPLERIRAEQDNLTQALRYALARADAGTVAATAAVLGGLWIIESNYPRVRTLASETAYLLSHFRPGPGLVEVTRTTLVLCTTYTFLLEGPRAVRSLVALRRLPPAPPDTLVRAVAVVLGAAPEDRSALYKLCDSDEPLVAGTTTSVVSYFWENEGDLDSALKAARRTLEAFEQRKLPYLQAVAHARISELSLQAERGEEARRHLLAAMPVLEQIGNWPDLVGVRWWMVLASLRSATSTRPSTGWSRRRRRRWTSRSARSPTASGSGPRSCSREVRSRPACACGGAPSTCWSTPRARSSVSTRIPARSSGPWRPRP